MKRIFVNIGVALLLMLSHSIFAGVSGSLFQVSATGTAASVNITLCLNGEGPLSCQNYSVSALTLNIITTAPNHIYTSVGIKINTPGYTIDNIGLDCNPSRNGYCLFNVSDKQAKTIQLVVSDKLSISPSTLPVAPIITEYSQTIAASGGAAPYSYTISSGSLPTGLTLDETSGVISGIPTIAGTYDFTVTATDDTLPEPNVVSQAYSIVVSGTLTLSPTTLPSATVAITYSQTITIDSAATPISYTLSVGSLPDGLTLNSSTGVISGEPTTAGSSTFTITATDADSNTGSREYTIVVSGVSLTSYTTNSGIPSATGTSLNTIWSGTPIVSYATTSSIECTSLDSISGSNLNFFFGASGQTDTSWNPGNTGGTVGPNTVDKCVRLCSDFFHSTCTNWIYNSGD